MAGGEGSIVYCAPNLTRLCSNGRPKSAFSDRRTLRDRERGACADDGGARVKSCGGRGNSLCVQGFVRQGEPLVGEFVSRTGTEGRAAYSGKDQSGPEVADPNGHSRTSACGTGRGSMRHTADSSVSGAAD